VAEVRNQGHRSGGVPIRVSKEIHLPLKVEMESLQFVGCSWFIGLIGLVSDSPRIKSSQPNYVRSLAPPLSPLAHT